MLFNGMIQLVPSDVTKAKLRSLLFLSVKNELADDQCGDHVTVAYKPSQEDAEVLTWWFRNGATFVPHSLRADDEICALFGTLEIDGEPQYEFGEVHITIGGNIPPVNSKRLTQETATRTEPIVGEFKLTLQIVEFDAVRTAIDGCVT